MMITVRDEMAPARYRRRLAELAEKWPIGARVRHESGWTGVVAADYPGNPMGLDVDAAHVVLGERPSNVAVCVESTINGTPTTAFYRLEVLHPEATSEPRQRQRTRRAA